MKKALLPALVCLFTLLNFHQTAAQCTLPITNVPVIQGPASVSLGNSYSYCLTNTLATLNYHWSLSDGTMGFTPSMFNTIQWSTAGTKTITITPKDNCGNSGTPITFTVTVVNQAALALPAAIAGSVSVCPGTSVDYTVPAQAGMTPVWHVCYNLPFASAPTLVPSGNKVTVTWNTSGTYTLYASYSNGTYASSPRGLSVTVQPTSVSAVSFNASPSPGNQACLGTTTTVTANAPGATAYNWSLNEGGTLSPNGNQATVTWTKTGGPYQLTVVASSACTTATQTGTNSVTVGPAPTAAPTVTSSNTQFCLNGTGNFTASPAGAASYIWKVTLPDQLVNTQIVPSNTYQVAFTQGGIYKISVQASNGYCGSNSSADYVVYVEPRPTLSISAPQPVGCINTEYIFAATDLPNYTYQWNVDGGTIVGDANKSTVHVIWTTSGPKNLTVSVTSPCGVGTATMPGSLPTFIVQSSAMNVPDISGTTAVCSGSYNYLINAGFDATNLVWSITPATGGTITIPSPPSWGYPYNPYATVNWTTPGAYTLKATLTNSCGAAVIKTTTITVSSGTKPNDVGITGQSGGCVDAPMTFAINAQTGVSYAWTTTPDGTITTSGSPATITWPTAGSKQIYVLPKTANCEGNKASAYAEVYAKPLGGTTSAVANQVCAWPTGIAGVTLNRTGQTGYPNRWQYRSGTSPSTLSAWQYISGADNKVSLYQDVINTTSANYYYEFRVSSGGSYCADEYSTTTLITVLPAPVVTVPTSTSICSQQPANITPVSSVAGTVFSWTVVSATAASWPPNGSGATIQDVLTNTGTGTQIGSVQYVIQGTANGCVSGEVQTVVSVKPLPAVTNTAAQLQTSICSNTALNFTPTVSPAGTTYSWTSASTAGVTGATATGTGAITNTLINTGTSSGTATYTITPAYSGCNGPAKAFVATVAPKVNIVAANKTICSGSAANLPLSPAANTFSWVVKSSTNVTGAAPGSGNVINNVLTATGTTAGTVVYTVSATAGGCSATPVDVTVTVTPNPSITNATPAAICSGQTFGFTPASTLAGTTFAYTASASSSSIGGYASGSGNISQTLTNTGTTDGQVTYTITPTASACAGPAATVVVTVKPNPSISNATPAALCSGYTFSFAPASPVAGTTFAYTATASGPSIGGYTSGTGTITQTLTNSGTTEGHVTYTITPTAAGCAGPPATLIVTVKPATTMPVIADKTLCSGYGTSIQLPQTCNWTVKSASNVSGAAAGSGTVINDLLMTITATAGGTVVYSLTTTANGCPSAPRDLTITVKPNPLLTNTAAQLQATICSGQSASFTPTANLPGTTFSYTVSAPPYITGHSAGTGSINQTLSSTGTAPANVTYHVSTFNDGCSGSGSNYVVTVQPKISASISGSTIICSPTATTLQALPAGATYAWSTGATTQSISTKIAGTYSVTVSKAGYCVSPASASKTLTTSNLSLSISQSGELCLNGEVTLTANGTASTFAWSTGSDERAITVYNGGTYSVTATWDNGCSKTASRTVAGSAGNGRPVCPDQPANPLATNGEGEPAEVTTVSPNPAHEVLNIHLAEPCPKPFAATLVDAFGRTTLTVPFETGDQDKAVSTSNVPAGVYFLQMAMPGQGYKTRQILVVHP